MYNKEKVKFSFKSSPEAVMQQNTYSINTITSNIDYVYNKPIWERCAAVVQGVEEMLYCNLIGRHNRESISNWARRRKQLHHLNYSQGILQAYSAHLFRKSPTFNFDDLLKNEQFAMFLNDCDYEETKFCDLYKEQADYVGMYGMVGYIVDKAAHDAVNIAGELKNGIYPFVQIYYPPSILDWQYIRNEYGRPILVYLKVVDDDGIVRCWWDLGDRIHWCSYQTNMSIINGRLIDNTLSYASMPIDLEEGDYPTWMDEIPFVLQYNQESGRRMVGVSDIKDISRSDINIVNRLSDASEIFEFASYPLMRKPYRRTGEASKDEVGASAILEFDPELPNSRPDWLLSPVSDPVNAIISFIDFTRKEIYRIGAFAGMDDITGASTGKALTVRFQQLDAKLVKKANYAGAAMNGILRLWMKWQQIDNKNVKVQMPTDYNVEDLAQDLESILSAETFVESFTFSKELQKIVVQKITTALPEEVKKEIMKEIDEQEEKEALLPLGGEETLPQQGLNNKFQPAPGKVPAEKALPGKAGSEVQE